MDEKLEQALVYLNEKKFVLLSALLKELEPADIAALFEQVSTEQLALVFRLLSKESAAEAFVEMDGDMKQTLIRSFNDTELKEIVDELYLDDTVDIIEEMPANVVKRILKSCDNETRQMINEVLKYPKDSAGSIMTIEYVRLEKNMTVQQAFARIRSEGVDKETIYTCYVTDRNRELLGLVTVKDLLLATMDSVIDDIMEKNIIYADTLEDKEQVAQKFDKYNFMALPVVDTEKRLVGIITIDDAMDVIQDENTEDIEKMAAMTPSDKPYLKTGIIETWKNRIPWLLLLMVSATVTGQIIQGYEDKIYNSGLIVLSAFIPMLMDTGGNAGGQASVTIIRSLALNDVALSDIFKIIWKELRVSVLVGITLAVANFAKILLVDNLLLHNGIGYPVAAVVCLTLIVTVVAAKFVGCTLPILAKRIGFDPAVMASPFITTIVDAISLLVYFNIASMLLNL